MPSLRGVAYPNTGLNFGMSAANVELVAGGFTIGHFDAGGLDVMFKHGNPSIPSLRGGAYPNTGLNFGMSAANVELVAGGFTIGHFDAGGLDVMFKHGNPSMPSLRGGAYPNTGLNFGMSAANVELVAGGFTIGHFDAGGLDVMFKHGNPSMPSLRGGAYPNTGLNFGMSAANVELVAGGFTIGHFDAGGLDVMFKHGNPSMPSLRSGAYPNTGMNFGVSSANVEFFANGLYVGHFDDKGFTLGGNLVSTADTVHSLGSPNRRWSDVFALNGVIQTSDKRSKKNIKELDYGLKEVLSLRPVSYHWNEDSNNEQKKIGFIAQDVVDIVPEAVRVSQNPKALMGMSYNQVVPVAVKAIQEQQSIIEKQAAEIESLKSDLAKIKQHLGIKE